MENLGKCTTQIANDEWFIHYHDCGRKAIVIRDGTAYCKIHDPEYIKEKVRKSREKYDESKCQKCGVHVFDGRLGNSYRYCPYCGTKR
jgi:hypothetical protein